MRLNSKVLALVLFAAIASSGAIGATPADTSTGSALSLVQGDSCSAFNSQVWAQTVFDERPWSNGVLDPDNDGLACEELPPGIAPALWTDDLPVDALLVELERVTDGDSIEVIVDGRREEVRLVGIDTHESGGPYQEVECYGPEAASFLKRLLGIGGEIYLEQDQEDRDQYGRLLRWVWADFETGEVYLLNEALVRAGYAERFRDTPNRRYVEELMDAEDFARRYDLGLWGACDDGGPRPNSAPPALPIATALAGAPEPACDPAYPDVCISSPPPDLQCSDVPYSHFRVLPPDPHNFDGNRDGMACEGPG